MKLMKILDMNMSHVIIAVSNQFGELEFNVKHVKTLTFAKVIKFDNRIKISSDKSLIQIIRNSSFWKWISDSLSKMLFVLSKSYYRSLF
jgi:hypothetical protein